MPTNTRDRKQVWCGGLDPPCPIGRHPRVVHINEMQSMANTATVASRFDVEPTELDNHFIKGHHLPFEDSGEYREQESERTNQENINRDQSELLTQLEEYVSNPTKYLRKLQMILTRVLTNRLAENAMADVTKLTKEVRENFRYLADFPITDGEDVDLAKEYKQFRQLVTMEVCAPCQVKLIAKMDQMEIESDSPQEVVVSTNKITERVKNDLASIVAENKRKNQ